MFDKNYFNSLGLGEIFDKVMASERLSYEDGIKLFETPNHTAVGALAHHVRSRMHGNTTYYVVNRHINYTNVCVNGCIFCAYRRDEECQEGAFTLTKEDILSRIDKEIKSPIGLDELHIVGGCHPTLPFDWFVDILREVRKSYPRLQTKAFTCVEIAHFAKLSGLSTREVLLRLKEAGLVMMPGGGAEIFSEKIRPQICPHKADAKEWLRISGEAHDLGIKTNCTMLFGHIESFADRVDHLCRLREQQDRSGGFTCFIPLPFQTENSKLTLPPEQDINTRGLDQLRTVAVSRLLLDNIPHIKAYWVMMGEKLAQTALWYGANDLDGTIVEEKIGHMAGANSASSLSLSHLEHMIRESGFVPCRRTATYDTIN